MAVASSDVDPHAPEPFLSKTPFDILMDDSYESKLNTLFSCTFEARENHFLFCCHSVVNEFLSDLSKIGNVRWVYRWAFEPDFAEIVWRSIWTSITTAKRQIEIPFECNNIFVVDPIKYSILPISNAGIQRSVTQSARIIFSR